MINVNNNPLWLYYKMDNIIIYACLCVYKSESVCVLERERVFVCESLRVCNQVRASNYTSGLCGCVPAETNS